MTLADIDMVRTMMVESKLAGDDLATIEQALTARITALQEINARAFSDEIQQITDPDADVSDVRQRIAESTEISLAQR